MIGDRRYYDIPQRPANFPVKSESSNAWLGIVAAVVLVVCIFVLIVAPAIVKLAAQQ